MVSTPLPYETNQSRTRVLLDPGDNWGGVRVLSGDGWSSNESLVGDGAKTVDPDLCGTVQGL